MINDWDKVPDILGPTKQRRPKQRRPKSKPRPRPKIPRSCCNGRGSPWERGILSKPGTGANPKVWQHNGT